MQTDLWLAETGNHDTCPLCSKPLKRGAQTCFACGFSNNPPSVWIDPGARSYQHGMPEQIANRPTPDPQAASSPIWQYESPDFEAAGSLPVLSLFTSETPTQPQPQAQGRTTRRLPNVEEVDTLPPGHGHAQRALIPAQQAIPLAAPAQGAPRSWTAGSASGSPSAQLIVRPARRKHLQQAARFNPLDRTRWWLLRPGRIEFILWLGGTLLLVGVTCLLLLVSALSFQWIVPFAPASSFSTNAGNNNAQQRGVSSDATGPIIMISDANSLVPGQSFQMRGQGFKPSSLITFYCDGEYPLFDQSHLPASARADAQGRFQSVLWLGTGSHWSPGNHIITARDASAAQSATFEVRLVAGPNSTVASTSPVSTSIPSGTHATATPTPSGPQGSPVSRPPVTVTPTLTPVSPTPSPTRSSPSPTPTATKSPTTTPTAAPTVKTSPTATITPASGKPTPAVSPTAAKTGLGNALNDSGDPPFAARLASVSPLVWVMVGCYLLSMMFLGAAGIVHRRHHRIVI
jgi:hypothetical protein